MAIRGQFRKYIVDLLSDMDNVPKIEGYECTVLEDGPIKYTYLNGDWFAAEGGDGVGLGESSGTAYRGDRGKTAYDHSQLTSGNPHSVTKSNVGLSNVDNTSDVNKPISTLQQAALDDKVDIVPGKELSENDYVNADKAKVDFISVSQPVNLDEIESRVNDLDASVVLKGTWDASAGTFPGGGAAQAGFSYIVSVQGTIDSVVFKVGDRVIAITDNASTGTFASNWFKADYTDEVLSVNGMTGAVTLTTASVADSANKRYVTDAQLTVIGNTSGLNTGDETAARIATINHATSAKSALVDADEITGQNSENSFSLIRTTWTNVKAFLKTYFDTLYTTAAEVIAYAEATFQEILVSGTNIKTINGDDILGSGDLVITGSQPNTPMMKKSATENTTILSGFCAIVSGAYEINDPYILEIEDGAIFEII